MHGSVPFPEMRPDGRLSSTGIRLTFQPPFAGDAVLHLSSASPGVNLAPPTSSQLGLESTLRLRGRPQKETEHKGSQESLRTDAERCSTCLRLRVLGDCVSNLYD